VLCPTRPVMGFQSQVAIFSFSFLKCQGRSKLIHHLLVSNVMHTSSSPFSYEGSRSIVAVRIAICVRAYDGAMISPVGRSRGGDRWMWIRPPIKFIRVKRKNERCRGHAHWPPAKRDHHNVARACSGRSQASGGHSPTLPGRRSTHLIVKYACRST
jgi:hypothetical protein